MSACNITGIKYRGKIIVVQAKPKYVKTCAKIGLLPQSNINIRLSVIYSWMNCFTVSYRNRLTEKKSAWFLHIYANAV